MAFPSCSQDGRDEDDDDDGVETHYYFMHTTLIMASKWLKYTNSSKIPHKLKVLVTPISVSIFPCCGKSSSSGSKITVYTEPNSHDHTRTWHHHIVIDLPNGPVWTVVIIIITLAVTVEGFKHWPTFPFYYLSLPPADENIWFELEIQIKRAHHPTGCILIVIVEIAWGGTDMQDCHYCQSVGDLVEK